MKASDYRKRLCEIDADLINEINKRVENLPDKTYTFAVYTGEGEDMEDYLCDPESYDTEACPLIPYLGQDMFGDDAVYTGRVAKIRFSPTTKQVLVEVFSDGYTYSLNDVQTIGLIILLEALERIAD